MDGPGTISEVGRVFLKLGLTSFGGPVAHLGYFRRECVARRGWLSDEAYADTVALCQFLPGPASSQVAFALGMRRAGLGGAMAASACFLMPSAVLMIGFAYATEAMGDFGRSGVVHGLKLSAIAVVAQAVVAMARKLCTDVPRMVLAAVAALGVLAAPVAWAQVVAIGVGGMAGWWMYRRRMPSVSPLANDTEGQGQSHRGAVAALVLFGVLLAAPPLILRGWHNQELAVFDSFYRSGALVFGGGHVVLPLLRAELVPRGWMNDNAFLAGYAAAQAVPGPLFSFAAYLGTGMYLDRQGWLGGLLCAGAIFLPGWLLIGGTLPYWHHLRERAWARAALRGTNATVVGVLLAALYRPLCTEGISGAWDAAAAVVALGLLLLRVPPLMVVLLCAAAGRVLLR